MSYLFRLVCRIRGRHKTGAWRKVFNNHLAQAECKTCGYTYMRMVL